MTKKKKLEVATFRFGIISEFVTGVKLSYGEKENLIREKISRKYQIPHSPRSSIGRSTIIGWIRDYKSAGSRIEGLFPKTRKDKGTSKRLSPDLKATIVELRIQHPELTVSALVKRMRQDKVIDFTDELSTSCIYKFLKAQNLSSINTKAKDRRAFEAEYPNEIWQSDVLHGPKVIVDKKLAKTYLIAIMDDHSRFIIHAEFYPNEQLDNLKMALKCGIETRGLPQKFYVDNGSCYSAINLEQITASLGIALKHSRPYTPQGRGKIERWFRTVRDNFLSTHSGFNSLTELNEKFDNWLEEYNNKIHSSTKETPYIRYQKNLECVRQAPANLIDYFRLVEYRKVKKDRSFQLKGILFEAPACLIDKKVELKYHKEQIEDVEIFFNNLSYGKATAVNKSINAKVGRDWNIGSGCLFERRQS